MTLGSLGLFAIWLFVILPLLYLPEQARADTFWGLGSTAWTAIGAISNAVYCLLTAGLLVFAIYQVLTIKRDAKINRTLAVCERYDIDPVLDQIVRRLDQARDDDTLRNEPKKYSVDLDSLFNYFESIAIGVNRGHYDRDIVRDQFEVIMTDHIEQMSGIRKWSETGGTDDIEHFDKMMNLYRHWKQDRES
jgi:hypothetical protein